MIMANCEIYDSCPYAQGQVNGREDERDTLLEKYCNASSLHCARYMIHSTLGAENVPADLFPDEKDKAYLVIAEKG